MVVSCCSFRCGSFGCSFDMNRSDQSMAPADFLFSRAREQKVGLLQAGAFFQSHGSGEYEDGDWAALSSNEHGFI